MISCTQEYSETTFDDEHVHEKKKLEGLWYTLPIDKKGQLFVNFASFTLISMATTNTAVQN